MRLKERIGLQLSKWMYFRKSSLNRNKAFYKNLIQPGDLCFDIGANIGGRTQCFLDLDAKVVAVEPQSIFYEALQKQFSSNLNFKGVRGAVGANKGTLTLKISSLFPMVSTLASKVWINEVINSNKLKVKYDRTEQVKVETLDNLISKYGLPNFCKIDVEGFEYQVLQGLTQVIPLLSFEFFNYDMNNTNLCLKRLCDLGYTQFNWSIGEQQQFKMPIWSNETDLLKDIQLKNTKKYSGDIYARSN